MDVGDKIRDLNILWNLLKYNVDLVAFYFFAGYFHISVKKLKHVLAKVDKLHFAVSSKLCLKFQISIWPWCQVQHIKLFITEN